MVTSLLTTYTTSVIENLKTFGELEYNELKLNSVIAELERDIMVIRLMKITHMVQKEEEAEKSQPEPSANESDKPSESYIRNFFSKIFSR